MLNKKIAVTFSLSLLALSVNTAIFAATENMEIYGKIHVSADYIDNGDTTDTTAGSNSSRIGFTGKKDLKHNLQAVWKLESDIDVSGERGELNARNRYLGLSHTYGKVIVGYHDTPFKSLGAKAGVFHDTIAERRGILGAGDGDNKMNIRGKNSVMYTSPKWNNVQLNLLHSAGDDTDSAVDENPVTSVNLIYQDKTYYLGIAYEDQSKPSVDAKGLRIGGGAKFGDTAINLIYEDLTSDTNDKFDRAAYGGSVTHALGDTTLKAQVFMSEDYKDKANSGGMLWGLGADYKLDKAFTVYAVVAGVTNDDNSNIVLAGSGHGEKYKPAEAGDTLLGVSGGMIYKF